MEQHSTTSTLSVQESIDLVKKIYDAFFRGDMDAMLKLYTDDIDWQVYGPITIPTTGPRRGKEQVREFFGKVNELLESEKFEVQQYVAQGNTVVSLGEYSWRSKMTGRMLNAHFAHVMSLRDGKICKFREFTDTAAALEAMID